MNFQKRAYLYALSAIALWSTIGSAFKLTLKYIDPSSLLLIAAFTAALVLLITLLIQNKGAQLFKTTSKQLLASATLGVLNPFLYYFVLLQAYDLLPAQEAGTLNYIWPLVLVLLSIPLLKQKIKPISIVAILISFAGIILISTHGKLTSLTFTNPKGVLLALGSAIFWSLYWIYNMKDGRDSVTKLFLNFSFGFLYTLIYLSFTRGFIMPVWQGFAGSVYIGLFEMGITFVLWLNALNYSSTTAKVSNLIYLSPFFSLIIIHFTVGETILPSTIAGLSLIVAGILLQQYFKR